MPCWSSLCLGFAPALICTIHIADLLLKGARNSISMYVLIQGEVWNYSGVSDSETLQTSLLNRTFGIIQSEPRQSWAMASTRSSSCGHWLVLGTFKNVHGDYGISTKLDPGLHCSVTEMSPLSSAWISQKSICGCFSLALPSATTEEFDFHLHNSPSCQLLLAHPHSLLLTRLPLPFLVDHGL